MSLNQAHPGVWITAEGTPRSTHAERELSADCVSWGLFACLSGYILKVLGMRLGFGIRFGGSLMVRLEIHLFGKAVGNCTVAFSACS